MHRIARLAAIALLALPLTACGGLFRFGGEPLPGPTISPTGTGGTGIPGGTDQGRPEEADPTTTEEPDFPG
jgi:hypothetical protein